VSAVMCSALAMRKDRPRPSSRPIRALRPAWQVT
jgi:hypothetical protein